MPSTQRKHGGGDAEGDRAVAGAAEQREVDIQAGEEHQQQLAEFRHEIRDRAIRAEEAENIWADDDTAEQQTHGCGNVQTTTKAGNGDEHYHRKREFREHRQAEEVVSDEVKDVRVHCLCSTAVKYSEDQYDPGSQSPCWTELRTQRVVVAADSENSPAAFRRSLRHGRPARLKGSVQALLPDVIQFAVAMNATARAVGLPPRLARHATTFLVRFAVMDHAKCGHSHFSHAGQPARTIFSV